jgi:hypothetical protein
MKEPLRELETLKLLFNTDRTIEAVTFVERAI